MSKVQSLHVGIYGRRNVGKSTLVNAITGQDVSIVSPVAGTTTDPVKRSYELLEAGPIILIDTAGIDDEQVLGKERVKKTIQSLKQVDLAILVTNTENGIGGYEEELIAAFNRLNIPYLTVFNLKATNSLTEQQPKFICLNAKTGEGVATLRAKLTELALQVKQEQQPKSLLGDVISKGDTVLLITPIDSEAPAGRLILPQVNVIRDILDNNAIALVMKENEVSQFLTKSGSKPTLVVTDSQLFKQADLLIPKEIQLTSFSIVLARQKGNFEDYLKGTPHISQLKDGDRILLLESCSHQTSCEDIGQIKIPRWLQAYTGKRLLFEMSSRLDEVKRPASDYAMVIQCGGCMVTKKQLANRLQPFIDAGVAVSNYGMAIAYTQGIFDRAVAPFLSTNTKQLT